MPGRGSCWVISVSADPSSGGIALTMGGPVVRRMRNAVAALSARRRLLGSYARAPRVAPKSCPSALFLPRHSALLASSMPAPRGPLRFVLRELSGSGRRACDRIAPRVAPASAWMLSLCRLSWQLLAAPPVAPRASERWPARDALSHRSLPIALARSFSLVRFEQPAESRPSGRRIAMRCNPCMDARNHSR